MTGGSSKSQSVRIKFDKEFRAIQEVATNMLKEAFGATQNQQVFQSALFDLLQPEFNRMVRENDLVEQLGSAEERQKFLRETIDRTRAITDQAAALGQQLSTTASNLGTLTESDRELISSAIGSARAVGQQQIDSFVETNFRNANEVAAARGLSPRDAPIGNIRGRVAEEAVTQKGLLESQLAGQEAELGLNLPMQRTALLGQIAGQQLGLAQAGEQFQAALAQNAEANRLNLAQTTGQLGLGLSGQGTSITPGVLGASRPAIGQTSSSAQGGISTRKLKRGARAVDAAEVLERLQALPVEAWQYVWDHPEEDAFHVGPYAEDFAEAFGGDGFAIDFLGALGVSMVALQEVTRRVERIEEAIGLRVVEDREHEVVLEVV